MTDIPDCCLVTWNTYFLTQYMEQIPTSEANQFAASDGILHVLWNRKVHYGINNLTSTVVIRGQLNPVENLTSHYLEIHLIINFTSKSVCPKWSLSLRFRQQKPL
jgi:hypothetical protein